MLNTLNSRSILRKSVAALLLLLVIVFLTILLKGMAWSPFNQKSEYSEVSLGETTMVQEKGKKLWVTRLSESQIADADTLKTLVHQDLGCDVAAEVCLIDSSTERQGVIIRFVKPKVFDENGKPKGIWPSFINPLNQAEYDLLGRGFLSNPSDAPKSITYKKGS